MPAFKTLLTLHGQQRLAQAQTAGVPVLLTHMAVGDGNGNPAAPREDQTFLVRERYRTVVNRVYQPDAGADPAMFAAELLVPPDVGGFTIREVGLYDETGALFAVASVPDAYKPTDIEGAFSDTIVRMLIRVGNASVVTLQVDPNVAVATHSWVLNSVNATTVIPGGLTGQTIRKRSNADGDIEWVDPADPVSANVWTREETQTLAANQVLIDLQALTTDGLAVFIDGLRLRAQQFIVRSATRIELVQARAAGTLVTLVQNEQTGMAEILFRAANLADVPNKALARDNLGIPAYVAVAQIGWGQLYNVPDTAARWPAWGEVTGKPAAFPPAVHRTAWAELDNIPAVAARWPTWGEVTGKPNTFVPSTHGHGIPDVTGLQSALDARVRMGTGFNQAGNIVAIGWDNAGLRVTVDAVDLGRLAFLSGAAFTGPISAPAIQGASSDVRLKRDITALTGCLDVVCALHPRRWVWRADGTPDFGFIAQEHRELLPEAVHEGEDGMLFVRYGKVEAHLVGAVQELERRLRELEARLGAPA